MTTLTELQDLLVAHAVDGSDKDLWEININSEVTRVKAADPTVHVDPAAAFTAASNLVDRILALGYQLVYGNTISAGAFHNFEDDDAVRYRGVINIGLHPEKISRLPA